VEQGREGLPVNGTLGVLAAPAASLPRAVQGRAPRSRHGRTRPRRGSTIYVASAASMERCDRGLQVPTRTVAPVCEHLQTALCGCLGASVALRFKIIED